MLRIAGGGATRPPVGAGPISVPPPGGPGGPLGGPPLPDGGGEPGGGAPGGGAATVPGCGTRRRTLDRLARRGRRRLDRGGDGGRRRRRREHRGRWSRRAPASAAGSLRVVTPNGGSFDGRKNTADSGPVSWNAEIPVAALGRAGHRVDQELDRRLALDQRLRRAELQIRVHLRHARSDRAARRSHRASRRRRPSARARRRSAPCPSRSRSAPTACRA